MPTATEWHAYWQQFAWDTPTHSDIDAMLRDLERLEAEVARLRARLPDDTSPRRDRHTGDPAVQPLTIRHQTTGAVLWTPPAPATTLRQTLEAACRAGASLAGAALAGAQCGDAQLAGAQLPGADLQHAALWGADLRGADLRGADLRSADLRGANLQDAQLAGAQLQGADVHGTVFPTGESWQTWRTHTPDQEATA
jgi:phage-related protein